MTDNLFISYSHKDNEKHKWLERLRAFLKCVSEDLPVSVWDDTEIRTGRDWRSKIAEAVSSARAAILVVGPGFLASDFIREHELPALLRAADSDELELYCLIVGWCPWEKSVLEKYQSFNNPKAPLESMEESDQNKVLNNLCLTIVDDMQKAHVIDRKPAESVPIVRNFIATIAEHLESSRAAFIAQARRRNGLASQLRDRLKIEEHLEYERMFFRYYDEMTREELFEFDQIRAVTEGRLYGNNRAILAILSAQPELRRTLPILAALKEHLAIWVNKYERVFVKTKAMCVLYVGVEDGMPFPSGVDQAVSAWLAGTEPSSGSLPAEDKYYRK